MTYFLGVICLNSPETKNDIYMNPKQINLRAASIVTNMCVEEFVMVKFM